MLFLFSSSAIRFSIYFFSSSYFFCAYIFSLDSPASFLTSSPILALSSGQRSASLALEDDDLWWLCNLSGYGFFFLMVALDLLLVSVAEGICLPLPLFLELARLLLEVRRAGTFWGATFESTVCFCFWLVERDLLSLFLIGGTMCEGMLSASGDLESLESAEFDFDREFSRIFMS